MKWLTLWLEDHPARVDICEDGSIQARNLDAQLFPMTAIAVMHVIGRLGCQTLNRRGYPHLIRHSSATFWANRLPYFKICKRFGWTTTSQMPQKCIDRAGVDELSVARLFSKGQPETAASGKPGAADSTVLLQWNMLAKPSGGGWPREAWNSLKAVAGQVGKRKPRQRCPKGAPAGLVGVRGGGQNVRVV